MSNEEAGAYIRLLAWSWGNGPLPLEEMRIARLVSSSVPRFRRIWNMVGAKWRRTPEGWVNDRLEKQRQDLEEFTASASNRGKAGAAARWNGRSNGSANSQSNGHSDARTVLDDGSSVSDLQSADQPQTEEQSGESPRRPLTPQDLADVWNIETLPPIPRCKYLTHQRKSRASARLRERPLEEWRAIVRRIGLSAFCRGENDRGWLATFDWLLQPDVAVKVLEGKYDDRVPAPRRDASRRLDKGAQNVAEADAALAAVRRLEARREGRNDAESGRPEMALSSPTGHREP